MQRTGRGLALRKHGFILLLAAAVTLAADQLTKAAARVYLAPVRSIPLIPGLFELSYVRNQGAAFGMMQGARPLFVVVAAFVVCGIAYVWFTYRPPQLSVALALGLVAGGALGNLIDRVAFDGRVTDFLYVHYWPVFNVADSAVVVGTIVLVFWLLFHTEDEDGEAAGPERPDDGEPSAPTLPGPSNEG